MSNPISDAAKKLKDAAMDYFMAEDRQERVSSSTPSGSPEAGAAPAAPASGVKQDCLDRLQTDNARLSQELEETRVVLKAAQDKLKAIDEVRMAAEKKERDDLAAKILAGKPGLDKKVLETMSLPHLQALAQVSGLGTDRSLKETPAPSPSSPASGDRLTVGYFDHKSGEWKV